MKRSDLLKNSLAVKKRCGPSVCQFDCVYKLHFCYTYQTNWCEQSCEIKGGSQEMAVIVYR